MKTKLRFFLYVGLLLVLIAAAVFLPGVWPFSSNAGASSTGAVSLTTGQESAIQGAGQILLLTPNINWVYVPVVIR